MGLGSHDDDVVDRMVDEVVVYAVKKDYKVAILRQSQKTNRKKEGCKITVYIVFPLWNIQIRHI